MQVAEKEMVRDEYPVPQEEKKEEDMEEIVQTEENNPDNINEEMEYTEDEEHSDDINRCLEEDVYSDIGIKALEDELDHLETALDHLEKKNDDIHAELMELLQCNREARKQFQESLQIEGQQSQ
ncbi:Bublin coiled-coil protein [Formica fusca]